MFDVQVVVRGVSSADEDQLEGFTERLRSVLGVEDPAVVFWPQDKELGACFQIKEEVLAELLQPLATSEAA